MSKADKTPKIPIVDLSRFCKSSFTLTFVVEIIGTEVWHDCNEGWLELGPVLQGFRIQYQLYPGEQFEVDILIWPHTAKVYCGTNYGWIRTWEFLERRWLAFSIRHWFPVRVTDLRNFVATAAPHAGLGALGAIAKADKSTDVFLPSLSFAERRQFAPVFETADETTINEFISELIWKTVENHIPMTFADLLFDTPYPVAEIRHQDAALFHIRNIILGNIEKEEEARAHEADEKNKGRRESKTKEKKKVPEAQKIKFEMKLSGDTLLAGIGRITAFEIIGDKAADQGEVIALISTSNVPAQDDLPVIFVNIGVLSDFPVEYFKKNRITHLYTRWSLSDEEHCSERIPISPPKTEMDFNDHHSVPLPVIVTSNIMSGFLDDPFQIELRGIRTPPPLYDQPKFFGYDNRDRDFAVAMPPPLPNQDTDIFIARTKIDVKSLSKINGFVRGEFPLYPPKRSVVKLDREEICTNDINAVRAKVLPELFIQPGNILQAQMTLEVSIGLAGCKPHNIPQRYSRLYCLISNPEIIMTILRLITQINETVLQTGNTDGLLTGFGLDTGDTVFLYVEGPKDGRILKVWELTEDFYPHVRPIFCTAAKYLSRLYPELLLAAMPFNILKMFVPLAVVLCLTPIYTRPALPLPTRSAVLKLGRLIAGKLRNVPYRSDMPTGMELKSFRLELCVAPRPPPVTIYDLSSTKTTQTDEQPKTLVTSATRINFECQNVGKKIVK
ncbi:unnamed protein product [Chrysodeixis includens]|uniref:Uncharacterized protein n=1 Tax=Chrysodeixis includens TaxID=689277 RepID=A0A9P0BPA0_CHRIL|nr:unnamed protein product [Chrysodeixis includens]